MIVPLELIVFKDIDDSPIPWVRYDLMAGKDIIIHIIIVYITNIHVNDPVQGKFQAPGDQGDQ
jgi:hypothetical protein